MSTLPVIVHCGDCAYSKLDREKTCEATRLHLIGHCHNERRPGEILNTVNLVGTPPNWCPMRVPVPWPNVGRRGA